MRRTLYVALILTALLAMQSSDLQGYRFLSHKWPSPRATFYVDIPGNNGLWNIAFEDAMAAWSSVTGFTFDSIGRQPADPCAAPGSTPRNGVMFSDTACGTAWGSTTLAITQSWISQGQTIQSGVIFNSTKQWDVYSGGHSSGIHSNESDFRRIAVHELGHALGLDHEPIAPSIMVPTVVFGSTLELPQADDIAGVTALYPFAPPRPANDNHADAITISGLWGSAAGNNTNATRQPGEGGSGTASIWFQWTADITGTVRFSAAGSAPSRTITVFRTNTFSTSLSLIGEGQETLAVDVQSGSTYKIRVASPDGFTGNIQLNWIMTSATTSTQYAVPTDGAGLEIMVEGWNDSTDVGYGRIQYDSSGPDGVALIRLREGAGEIHEAAVPATHAFHRGRIYAEMGGVVDTGLAIANPNGDPMPVDFHFTDAHGVNFGFGKLVIPANGQIAAFLTEPPFNGPTPFEGTFTFHAQAPVASTAIRSHVNERGHFLFTTLPVAELGTGHSGLALLPHFADGAGWTTQLILMNPTDNPLEGTYDWADPGGNSVAMELAGITCPACPASSYTYSIPPHSQTTVRTTGISSSTRTGRVKILPANSQQAPVVTAILSFRSGVGTTGLTSVQATAPHQRFRTFGQFPSGAPSGNPSGPTTGLAIATDGPELSLQISLASPTMGGTATITVPANGQTAFFLNELPEFRTLAVTGSFQGLVTIAGDCCFSVVNIRARQNLYEEFIFSTAPAVRADKPLIMQERYFPHIVVGQGYLTSLFLFSGSTGMGGTGVITFVDQRGEPMGAIRSIRSIQ